MANDRELGLWLNEIEDDAAEQHKSALRSVLTPTAYCCLGHACNVFQRETGRGFWVLSSWGESDPLRGYESGSKYYFHVDGYYHADYLPEPVKEWFGLPSEDPNLYDSEEDETSCASEFNDTGRSLEEIGTLIRDTFLR